jgi:MoxR-like ATPase
LLDYPTFDQEVEIVKSTTSADQAEINIVISKEEIVEFQNLIKKVPVADNVIEYAVQLVQKTRPGTDAAAEISNTYLEWGAGPRGSQYLITGAKFNSLINGKFSPDIEDVQAIAKPILRHRILRNFKAEAESVTVDYIIEQLL